MQAGQALPGKDRSNPRAEPARDMAGTEAGVLGLFTPGAVTEVSPQHLTVRE